MLSRFDKLHYLRGVKSGCIYLNRSLLGLRIFQLAY